MALPLKRPGAVVLAFFAMISQLRGQVIAREYQIKAAFLQSFTEFVQWPSLEPDGRAPLVIAIVGDDPFGPMLQTMLDRAPAHGSGHPLRLAHLRWNDDLSDCHIIFVSGSELQHVSAIIAAAPNALTISDLDSFARRGGMIELRRVGDRIRFEINVGAARRAGLHISSKLLGLAVRVYDEQAGGRS